MQISGKKIEVKLYVLDTPPKNLRSSSIVNFVSDLIVFGSFVRFCQPIPSGIPRTAADF